MPLTAGSTLLSVHSSQETKQSHFPSTGQDPARIFAIDLFAETCLHYQTDATGMVTFVSPSSLKLLGYPPEEMVGRDIKEFCDDESTARAALTEFISQTSDSANVMRRLSIARRADGESAYLEINERLLTNEKGEVVGHEGVAYDLTHYIKSDLAVRESERKYRRLVEELGEDYIIFTNLPNGQLTYVSPSIYRVLGFEAEDVTGKNWREVIGENFVGRDRVDEVRSDLVRGIRFHKFTVEIPDVRGHIHIVEIQQRPIFSPDGHYVSMEGIAKDITEFTRNARELQRLKDELEERVAQRTAELVAINQRLVESESRYRNVVEDQTEFICRWLPGGKFTFVNEAYCRYMKKPYGELIGHSFLPMVYEEDRAHVVTDIESLSPEQPTKIIEHRVIRADGSIGWNQWTNRAIFDEHGQSKGYQSVGRDITDLKAVEDLVLEREEHLKRVSRLAIMGELIAGIAHEIHQPLHAAQLFAEAARRNLEMGTERGVGTAIDCSREISNAINRTATIIRHLRSFTTNKPTKIEPLNINEVVREVADVMSYETRRTGVKLAFRLAENLPLWSGDRVQIQQILVHLLRNAYEAMPQEERSNWQVVITTRQESDCILVDVTDNGIGTEKEDIERLFDAFYTTKPEGLGMGLSICKTIAESLNAEVEARKNSEGGMTFTLRLPLVVR